MRLTLRTLLAYMDDILDAADKEQLAQKIESSEFAEDLVRRTRDTVRRLRLSAPQVIGSGMGLDPNTVAEYLDNALPPDSVADFERICLESDMHLAEAAACHHVLTMVLGEPADVDPIMRQRMYGVPGESEVRKRVRVEGAHVAVAAAPPSASVQVVASPGGVVPPPTSDGEGVPEYLRASSWSGYRGALLAVAAVVLVGTAVVLFGERRGWFGGTAEGPGPTADTTGELALNTVAPTEETAAPVAAAEAPTAAEPGEPMVGSPSTNSATPNNSTSQPGAASPEVVPAESAATPTDAVAQQPSAADSGEAQANDRILPPAGEDPSAAATEPVVRPGEQADLATADDAAGAVLPAAGDATAQGATAVDAPGAQSPPIDETAVAEEVPTGPMEMGTYLGGKTVLLRHDDRAGAWFRVQPRSAVIAGDRLLSLPEFRSKITLASGVHVDISGGTQVTMRTADELQGAGLPAAAADEPGVEVVYGRLILIDTSGEEQPVRVAFGPSVAATRLARNARLAIEVERKYVPGHDPRQSPAPVIARVYAPDGGVAWQDANGTRTIHNASRWTISEGDTSDAVADASPPDWIDQEPVVQLSEQRYGAPVVESRLVSDQPADIQLLELFQTPGRREVKSLAAKSSIHVGVFEPFIDALRDSEQKSNWRTHIETLRSAMALSPESAAKVWKALVEQRGPQAAANLNEMLCGYNEEQIGRTAEQVKSGALLRLIDWLEDDSLDYRVLAWHNLWEITGKRLMPDPSANLKERTRNVRQWRSRLEAGELQPGGR